MLIEQTPRPAPLSRRARSRVSSAVTVSLMVAAGSAVLVLLGYGWGGYLMVVPIVVFGLLLVWRQRRSYSVVRGQKTIGVSREVIRVHSLTDGAGLHEVGAATEVEADADRVTVRTGDDELLVLYGLQPEDAERVADAMRSFLAASAS